MDRKALLTIERELWTGGPEAYHRHVADECLVAFTEMAGTWTREQVVASVEEGPRWRDLEMDVQGWIEPAEDIVLVTYRARATRGDDHYHALVSSGYVRRDDAWKLAFHQQTPLPG